MDKISDKRQLILDTTLKLIVEKGFHGTAMSKVAKEAGVSAGIIYHYFKSKDDLILELYRYNKQKSMKALSAILDRDQPLAVQVRMICEHFFRYSLENQEHSVFCQQFATSPYFTEEIENEMAETFRPVTECIEQAQKEMIIKDFPIDVIATLTVDVANGLAQRQAIGRIVLTGELVEQVVDSLWEAIRR
jgi:AcrR family transcriptional regulator